jgi:hypothetical protein
MSNDEWKKCSFRILWFIDHFRIRSIPFEFKRQCGSYPEMTLHLLICISKMAATQNWKWDFELSQIKWDKNEWQPWNIRGSWSVWKSEAASPYTGLNSLCKMSEIHEIGGVRHQIYQRILFMVNLRELIWIPELLINYYSQTLYV